MFTFSKAKQMTHDSTPGLTDDLRKRLQNHNAGRGTAHFAMETVAPENVRSVFRSCARF